jgi:hypothetical protein
MLVLNLPTLISITVSRGSGTEGFSHLPSGGRARDPRAAANGSRTAQLQEWQETYRATCVF